MWLSNSLLPIEFESLSLFRPLDSNLLPRVRRESNYTQSKRGRFKLAFEPNGRTRTKFLSKSDRSLNFRVYSFLGFYLLLFTSKQMHKQTGLYPW